MSEPAAIHIIDDDAQMRRGLQTILESASLPARAYESAGQFLEEVDLESPGCVVIDLRLPFLGGIELLRQLEADHCRIPVIVISGHDDVQTAVRSMKLGAVDVLQQPVEPARLVDAARRAILQSGEICSRQSEATSIRRRIETLTHRELGLLNMVVAGKSNKKIAAELAISIKTVANHRASLMAKTQALNAADLARMATIVGLTKAG